MALSAPKLMFGIHSFSPYNLSTGEFYGTMKVLQGSSLTLSGETIELTGGSSRFPWGVEDGKISAELSLTFNEYPNFLYELFLGKAVTDNAAEASGNCSALTNMYGTSVMVATTGIATATVKAAAKADLKFGKYVVKCTGAAAVDVYASSDVDFSRGTDKAFETDLLKITATPLTITTGAATEIPGFGIELTGGSGTIGMTTGDTATFEVRPVNTDSTTVTVGGTNDVFPSFGAILYGQQRGSGEMVEIDVFSLKALGFPINFNSAEFSESEITMKASYYAAKSGVFSQRTLKP